MMSSGRPRYSSISSRSGTLMDSMRCVVRKPSCATTPGVNAISAIAGGLGLQLVAEGIETGGQRKFLTRAGYRYGQGFLFSESLPPDDATALLQRDMDRAVAP